MQKSARALIDRATTDTVDAQLIGVRLVKSMERGEIIASISTRTVWASDGVRVGQSAIRVGGRATTGGWQAMR